MTSLALLSAVAALSAARPAAAPPDAPGLDVDNRCTAAALVESGFNGAVRVRLPASADRSMESCDVQGLAMRVPEFRATARPCFGLDLRRHGFVGRLFTPVGMVDTPQERACEAQAAAGPPVSPSSGQPAPAALTTFRRPDGVKVTTMRPVPNPEDMDLAERRWVYGYWE